jgi:hypothetical protein
MMNTLSSLSSITTVAKNAPPPIVYPELNFTTYTDVTANINNNPTNMYYGSPLSTELKIAFSSFGGNIFYYGKRGTVVTGNIHQLITSDNSGNSFQNVTFLTNGPLANTNTIMGCCMDVSGIYRYFSYTSDNTSATNTVYRSIDSGAIFTPITLTISPTPPSTYVIRNIQCSNNGKYVIVAGFTGGTGVKNCYTSLSCDYGANFSNISNNIPQFDRGSAIMAWVSNDGYRVLIGASRVGLYFSSNARNSDDTPNTNATYTNLQSVDTGAGIGSISVSDNEEYIMFVVTSSTSKGVYVAKGPLTSSTSFSLKHSSLAGYTNCDINYSGTRMAFTSSTNVLYYSTNYGANWSSYTFTGFTSIRGFGLVKKDAVGYIILNTSTSVPTWYKIT